MALANRLRSQGITRFTFSRHEYPERLDKYLESAQHSIKIVSVSLRVTGTEYALTELFRNKLASNPAFEIYISLLQPNSSAVVLMARALNIDPAALNKEIDEMLGDLKKLRDSLPSQEKGRLHIMTHDCLPMGSVIMLDCTPISGLIQVETKLYGSPRAESFGFEIRYPSPFYERNLVAWNRVLAESQEV